MGSETSATPRLHYQFPFQTMWDDAVVLSSESGKPTLVFDLDLVDTNSIKLAKEVIESKELRVFIKKRFEPAINDFAVDPPPSVGLDSLRNLGWRLSGLEKDYHIVLRPTIIVIGLDKKEIERIPFPQNLTAKAIQNRLQEILEGRNTLASLDEKFWQDTSSIELRERLIDMFQERSKYDSVLYHLKVLSVNTLYPTVARRAAIRYANTRLAVEGNTAPTEALIASLGHSREDSLLHLELLQNMLERYESGKKIDSVSAMYDRIIEFTHGRDPEVFNDYAWSLANYKTGDMDHALSLINEAIGKNGRNPNFYDTRALVYGRMHRFQDAIRDEETAISYARSKDDKHYFEEQIGYYKKLKAQAESAPSQSSEQSKP